MPKIGKDADFGLAFLAGQLSIQMDKKILVLMLCLMMAH
jgi:hypothetical protein